MSAETRCILNQFVTSIPVLPIHVFALMNTAIRDQSRCYTVKSHFKALGLYNLIRGFGWACMYKRRGGGGGAYIPSAYKWNKNMFRNDEIKRIWETN